MDPQQHIPDWFYVGLEVVAIEPSPYSDTKAGVVYRVDSIYPVQGHWFGIHSETRCHHYFPLNELSRWRPYKGEPGATVWERIAG